ncbi:acetyl esterase [Microbacteriaceae bacterium SG_E_30_P1]|uniref:Acetyl esterase n=1 Tax=Antiquaquibacter oligotrophicus TaxID=2880260 RepID=A0ABT6KLK1_9MICO|nr:alpha/beta hydrolase [Antiquaquibacter oligotrophicus]MDH6180626.1 acetyl esterase [Antiquaquibacter oligotrophicus]UDF13643.1 alpha/beta hydrolase [Antiquaquibacter oligotrophicus]
MPIPAPRLSRVPVWAWRALMAHLGPRERRRFNVDPLTTVEYSFDIDYVGDGIREHTLDVIAPKRMSEALPVYVYFHGGGWTSGDKAPLTRYCATQAESGMVVVNVNYRMAPRHRMREMLADAHAALDWVHDSIEGFGGDPGRVVLGGDSAGGQLAALAAATSINAELATHYGITRTHPGVIRGLVQHCAALDFSVIFERGFILSTRFVRMLLPEHIGAKATRAAARFLSPIEWVDPAFPPTLVTTSRPDPFYRASLNFVDALRRHRVPVEVHIDENAQHTWQQDSHHPGSRAVYERMHDFVARVVSPAPSLA